MTIRLTTIGLVICLAIAGVAVAAPPATGVFDKPIPNSRFPTYVKFAGDPGNENIFAGQANVVGVPAPTEGPWFVAGFFRPEDFDNFGALVSWGCQDERGAGLAAVILTGRGDGYQLTSFQWSDADLARVATAASPLRRWNGPMAGRGILLANGRTLHSCRPIIRSPSWLRTA